MSLRDDLVGEVDDGRVEQRAGHRQRDELVPPRLLLLGPKRVDRDGVEWAEEDRVERADDAQPERQVEEDRIEGLGVEEPQPAGERALALDRLEPVPACLLYTSPSPRDS